MLGIISSVDGNPTPEIVWIYDALDRVRLQVGIDHKTPQKFPNNLNIFH